MFCLLVVFLAGAVSCFCRFQGVLMRKPLLFLPGPMQVPEQVRVAGDRPLFSHRSSQMSELLSKLEAGCKPLFGTRGDILCLAASGRGSMESAVVNLTSPGEDVIVIVGGTFAKRWADIATAYGVSVHTIDVDWQRGATLAEVDRALKQWPNARVIFHTWIVSSTGVLNDTASSADIFRT